MPASLKYTWEQTNESIEVVIPFKGKSLKNADVYCSDLLLKISTSPFFLQLDLQDYVVPTTLRAVKNGDNLYIHVSKSKSESKSESNSSNSNSNSNSNSKLKQPWKSLVFEGTKEETRARREQSMDRRSLELKQMHEHARKMKVEEGKITLRNQVRRCFHFILFHFIVCDRIRTKYSTVQCVYVAKFFVGFCFRLIVFKLFISFIPDGLGQS